MTTFVNFFLNCVSPYGGGGSLSNGRIRGLTILGSSNDLLKILFHFSGTEWPSHHLYNDRSTTALASMKFVGRSLFSG